METVLYSSTVVDLESMVCSMLVETALLTQKSLLWLLFVIGSRPNGINVITDLTVTDQRFPLAELNKGKKPAAENMDAGETEDAKNKKKKVVNNSDGQNDDESEGENSDDEEEEDVDGESSDEEDDDDDDDEDDDDDDDDDEDDDDEDDEEEEDEDVQPPSKRRK